MGWGKGYAHHCERIHGYPEAKRYFETRKAVRSKRWTADERPLVSSTEIWFKTKRGPNDDYYDLCLYRQSVVRYFRPEEDGSYRVLLANTGYRRTGDFLGVNEWGWWYKQWRTTCGKEVMIPLSTDLQGKNGDSNVPANWSADLWFDKSGLLILEKSDHRPVYTRKSGSEDKAARKQVLSALENVLTVLMLRLPTFHADSAVCRQRGEAFGGHREHYLCYEDVSHILAGAPIDDGILTVLLPFAQEVYNVALSKQVVKSGEYNGPYWGEVPGKVFPSIPEESFRRALRNALIRHSGLAKQSVNVPLPQFPEKLPRRYFFYKV